MGRGGEGPPTGLLFFLGFAKALPAGHVNFLAFSPPPREPDKFSMKNFKKFSYALLLTAASPLVGQAKILRVKARKPVPAPTVARGSLATTPATPAPELANQVVPTAAWDRPAPVSPYSRATPTAVRPQMPVANAVPNQRLGVPTRVSSAVVAVTAGAVPRAVNAAGAGVAAAQGPSQAEYQRRRELLLAEHQAAQEKLERLGRERLRAAGGDRARAQAEQSALNAARLELDRIRLEKFRQLEAYRLQQAAEPKAR